jgi:hypothetical protein
LLRSSDQQERLAYDHESAAPLMRGVSVKIVGRKGATSKSVRLRTQSAQRNLGSEPSGDTPPRHIPRSTLLRALPACRAVWLSAPGIAGQEQTRVTCPTSWLPRVSRAVRAAAPASGPCERSFGNFNGAVNRYNSHIVYIDRRTERGKRDASQRSAIMLTVTHLCYFATVVTIGILLGVVIQAKAYAGVK